MSAPARLIPLDAAQAPSWAGFAATLLAAAAATAAMLLACVLALDPYGRRAAPGREPGPIVDINQRFMHPQILRGRRFDAAVFGTSTSRHLDPLRLSNLFPGARFASLGMNAGTPYEQARLAELFLREVERPSVLIFGLDPTWCAQDADAPAQRVTFRGFPEWLYDDQPWNDLPHLVDLTSLELAGRVLLVRLGLARPRVREDGFDVFTPPEWAYDLARARQHIWGSAGPREIGPDAPASAGGADAGQAALPALAWLAELVRRAPRETRVVLAFMPRHVAFQPLPGSAEAAQLRVCKAEVARIAHARGGSTVAVDFVLRSPITMEDAHWWDALHAREPVARRTEAALAVALTTGRDAPDGFYRVLTPAATD